MKGLCDDCDAVIINGALCHEHGCPTAARQKREEVALDLNEAVGEFAPPDDAPIYELGDD